VAKAFCAVDVPVLYTHREYHQVPIPGVSTTLHTRVAGWGLGPDTVAHIRYDIEFTIGVARVNAMGGGTAKFCAAVPVADVCLPIVAYKNKF
jgi:hypothetical protein